MAFEKIYDVYLTWNSISHRMILLFSWMLFSFAWHRLTSVSFSLHFFFSPFIARFHVNFLFHFIFFAFRWPEIAYYFVERLQPNGKILTLFFSPSIDAVIRCVRRNESSVNDLKMIYFIASNSKNQEDDIIALMSFVLETVVPMLSIITFSIGAISTINWRF